MPSCIYLVVFVLAIIFLPSFTSLSYRSVFRLSITPIFVLGTVTGTLDVPKVIIVPILAPCPKIDLKFRPRPKQYSIIDNAIGFSVFMYAIERVNLRGYGIV